MTKYNKFQLLDDEILQFISDGVGHPIYSKKLNELAKPLLAYNKTPFPTPWRLIDRRMQTLRKAGKITYDRSTVVGHGQWVIVKKS